MKYLISKVQNLYFILFNSFALFFISLKQPKLFDASNFKTLTELMMLILEVGETDNDRMIKIATVNSDLKQVPLISIWAGKSHDADPTEKISELHKEISSLKAQLSVLRPKKT